MSSDYERTEIGDSALLLDGVDRLSHVTVISTARRRLIVRAGNDVVRLADVCSDFPANFSIRDKFITMTPAEARHIASLLVAAADVVQRAAGTPSASEQPDATSGASAGAPQAATSSTGRKPARSRQERRSSPRERRRSSSAARPEENR